MNMTGLKKRQGFTLIEIIIVVVILGILAAVALPKVTENIGKSVAAEAFNVSSEYTRAIDRCLANQAAGAPLASGDTNMTACIGANFAGTLTAVGMQDPGSANFTYSQTSGSGINPVVFKADAITKNGATAGTDMMTFTIDVIAGTSSRVCAGIFAKMCK